MKTIEVVINIILIIFSVLMVYKTVFIAIGFFSKSKIYKDTDKKGRFGVLIAARNEERVIKNLIDSVKNQNYDSSLIDIFVVVDNSTDKTAEICSKLDVNLYIRNDISKVSKGYALSFLVDSLIKENKINNYDYFAIFDSDNIVHPNFFYEMNKAMATGLDGCTCYRNSKNFKTNPISSGYSLHWYFNNLHAHRPRSVLGLSTHVTGTGYVFKKELILDGWKYVDLTEDASMSLDMISEGKFIGYNEQAEIYDEQPTDLKTTIRQRLRWKRGTYYSFFTRFKKIIKGMFTNKSFKKKFACYDCFFTFFPYDIVSTFLTIILNVLVIVIGIINKDLSLLPLWIKILKTLLNTYILCFVCGLLTLIKERKKIHCNLGLAIIYLFLYPWYDLISLPISIAALFINVKWKPIIHKDEKTYLEITKK
ncbi:MAG: glycosyltransferase family 2 protein [Bacilli bacterium]|nr:glycosyltransferase family 2 protein [Bacillales bacterium]MDY2575648.1 glycosyltransferase family 2 protein [Bacilli bacterium]